MAGEPDTNVLRLTAQIVSAHIGKNRVAADALPEVIQSVHRSLAAAHMAGVDNPAPEPAPLAPAVPIRRSVFPDHLVCLEDGMELKTFKRHLQTSHGMTPEQYRRKWGLPDSYPMVAPNYASHRSSLARQTGFGRKPGSSAPEQASPTMGSERLERLGEHPVTTGQARRARGYKG